MLQAAEAEHADEAIRPGGLDHLTRFLGDGLRTADQRCAPFIEPLDIQATGKVSKALGELRQIVERHGIAAPEVIGRELPETRKLRAGLLPGLVIAIGDIDVAHHDRIAGTGQILMLGSLLTIRFYRTRAVSQRLARERKIPTAARYHRRAVRRSGTVIDRRVGFLQRLGSA